MKLFLNVEEIASELRVAKSWIYERTRKGSPDPMPHFKLGKYLRFDPKSKAFRRWLRSQEVHRNESR